ncbi:MAG: hypothetical protein JST39_24085, partial [Bacteroidetes bacterium]|nr:hypothetical protein [Bacteroidota bacterium]
MLPLLVPYLPVGEDLSMNALSSMLDAVPRQAIACNSWPKYEADVKAGFAMMHSGDLLLLKYYIKEKHLLAREKLNGNIHHDSCVEFFVAFRDDAAYYNLEFNCLGTAKVGYGAGRTNRVLLDEELVKMIGFSTAISAVKGRCEIGWELLLVIPKEVFTHHALTGFNKMSARCNFYKCGSRLPVPHFLSWNR